MRPLLALVGGLAIAGVALGPLPVRADEPDLAFGAYQRGLYRTAFAEATKRVEKDNNDAAAMALLGQLLASGLGVAPDLKKAADWFGLAAARGDRNAAYALAMMKLEGHGIPKDKARAVALLKQASAAGQPSAAYNLGLLALGENTPAGDARGVELIRRGAEAGVPEAEYALAILLREGKRIEPDPVAAANMMELAARDAYEPAEVEYAIMLFNADGVQKNEAGAAKLFMLAASRGNPIAQNRLAHLYVAGRGVPADLVEAAAWNALAHYAGRDDPWLDNAVKGLTPEQREKVAGLVRQRMSALQLGIMSP